MKELLVVIGLILLGGIIITTVILGAGDGTLENAALELGRQGNNAVDAVTEDISRLNQ
ncbi:MAG: hypothetical protein GX663_09930 [Clostridiales bacterium]|nr:hypothetical protein [Clostridiales bacterium]